MPARGVRAAGLLLLAAAALFAGAAPRAAAQDGPCDAFAMAIAPRSLKARWLHDPTRSADTLASCFSDWPTSLAGNQPALEDLPATWPARKTFRFDGSGYFTAPSAVGNMASAFSLSFWFKTAVKTGDQTFLRGGTKWNLRYSDGFLIFAATNPSNSGNSMTAFYKPPDSFADGTWHHLVFTLGGSIGFKGEFYVDAVKTFDQTVNGVAVGTGGGAVSIGGPSFQGSLDDIRIYNRVLNVTEVTALYHNYRVCPLPEEGYYILVALVDGDVRCFGEGACHFGIDIPELWGKANATGLRNNPVVCTAADYLDPQSWCYKCSDIAGKSLPKPSTTTTAEMPMTSTATRTSTSLTSTTTTFTRSTSATASATRSRTRTTFTTRAGQQASCNSYVELCQRCASDGVYAVNSTAAAGAQMSDDDFAVFSDVVSGATDAIFGISGQFPPLAVSIGSSSLCLDVASSQLVTASDLFATSDLNAAAAICAQCIGGLPALNVTAFFLQTDRSGAAQYGRFAASLSDIPIAGGVVVTSITLGVTYEFGLYTATGTARIRSPAFQGTAGPLATLTATNASLRIDANFDGLGWGLWQLLDSMGLAVEVPDAALQAKLRTVGTLKSVYGSVCAPGAGAPCDHSIGIIATVAKGELISLDGGNFRLEEVLFEASYQRANGSSSFTFAVTGVWKVAGQAVSARAAVEVSMSRRSVVWSSEMQERGEDRLAVPGTMEPDRLVPGRRRRSRAATRGAVPAAHALVPRAPKFVITLESGRLPLGAILTELATSVIPADLSFVNQAIGNLFINDFFMQAVLAGEGSYQFRVRGSPSLVPVATMEMQAGTIESKRTAAAALVIEAGTFSSISTLLTALGSEDMNFNAVPVAPSNAGTAVFAILSYSSVDLNSNADWKWTTPSLAQETSITKGLTVAADFGFPADCKGDSICITFRGLLGSARLRAAIRVKSDEFAASAAVVNLKINDDWMLNKVGFELVLGKKTRLAFTGEMSVKVDAKQSLTFGVEVAAIFTPPKVELKGYMVGMWSNAFGIPRFAVGNIVVAMGVTATSPILGLPMPAFTVGGEIAIGPQPCYANDLPPPRTFRCTDWTEAEIKQVLDPNADRANGGPGSTERLMCARDKARSYYEDRSTSPCGCRCCMLVASKPRTKCISGSGYVGIDPQNPDNNWFGIKMRNIVLQSIFDAFVDGAVTLPSVLAETGFPGILTASYSMISEQEPVPGIVFPRGINIKGAFNMFGYKGKAEIAVDPTNGFLVDVSAAPLTIGGDILILAKNRSALNEGPFVYIDARGQKMVLPTIQGSAFISLFGGVVSQSVIVDIVMPNRLKLFLEREFFGLSARANISADLSLKGWPSMGVGAYVEFAGLDVAQKFVSKVLAQISAWCQDGVRKLGEAQASVERARGDVSRTLLSVCRKDQCVKEVKEYWGCTSWAMQIKCPEPSPCPWWDLFCHGKNFISGMCELVKQIIIWICRAWDTIREVISDAICDVGCAAARVANEVAQVGMTVAQGVLEVAKGVADIASKVLDAIAKALNFFTISMMSAGFDFRISGATAAAGRFYCDIRGELASRPWTVGFEVDLGDLLGTASRLFLASIKPVLTSVFGRRRQLERTLPYSPFSDTSPALADPHDPLPEIRAVLADPAVRALLAGAKMYRGVGALGGANVTVDLQFVPEGVDGFLAHAGEFRGDIPHRNKWDEGRRRNRKRSEVPTLWTRDPLEGEAYVRYLEDSLGI